jgi:hypothetical protein
VQSMHSHVRLWKALCCKWRWVVSLCISCLCSDLHVRILLLSMWRSRQKYDEMSFLGIKGAWHATNMCNTVFAIPSILLATVAWAIPVRCTKSSRHQWGAHNVHLYGPATIVPLL